MKPRHCTVESSLGRESVVPSSNQHNEPALAPPSTMPRSHAWRKIASMPCAFQIACWLRVLPPEKTMPSTDRKTSSQLCGCSVLATKLIWCDGSTLSGAQLRYHPTTPSSESALAVGKYSNLGRA